MPRVKICAPIFKDGVRVHNTGETPELPDSTAATFIRRGWGETYKGPAPASTDDADKKGSKDEGKGGKGGKDK